MDKIRLKELREAKGISQHKVGVILDIPQSKISDIERGKRRLKLDEAVRIASYFDVKVDDILIEKDWVIPNKEWNRIATAHID